MKPHNTISLALLTALFPCLVQAAWPSLEEQRKQATEWLPFFEKAATTYDVPVDVLIGIASHETGMRNIKGDRKKDGTYHGYGVMQVDIDQAPDWVRAGKWREPQEAIRKGTEILAAKRDQIKANQGKKVHVFSRKSGKWYSFTGATVQNTSDLWAVAAASYNTGMWGYQGFSVHGNPDVHTYGGNYVRDVIAKSAYFTKAFPQKLTSSFVVKTGPPSAPTNESEVSGPPRSTSAGNRPSQKSQRNNTMNSSPEGPPRKETDKGDRRTSDRPPGVEKPSTKSPSDRAATWSFRDPKTGETKRETWHPDKSTIELTGEVPSSVPSKENPSSNTKSAPSKDKPASSKDKPSRSTSSVPSTDKPAPSKDKPSSTDKPAPSKDKPSSTDKPAPSKDKPSSGSNSSAPSKDKTSGSTSSAPSKDKTSGVDKPGGGDKPSGGDKRGGGDKPSGGDKRGGGDKPSGGDKRGGGDKPSGGDKRGGGDKPSGGDKRGGADKPSGGRGGHDPDKPRR